MNCWHCNTELLWGGDHDYDGFDGFKGIVTNLSCRVCNAFVEIYLPVEEDDDKEKDNVR